MLLLIIQNGYAQPFDLDNIVFENVVFEDAGANTIYLETNKETRFNELIQILPQHYHDKAISPADEAAMTILLAYSYYYQDEYYDALVFNRMATKDMGKKITGKLQLANKVLTAMIYERFGDLLGADKILQNLTTDRDLHRFQVAVFSASLNVKTHNYKTAYSQFQLAANYAGQVSVFDEFNVYYNLSKTAEAQNKKQEQLAYALMADSVIHSGKSPLLCKELTYTFNTSSGQNFLDSLKKSARLNLAIAYRKNGYYTSAISLLEESISTQGNAATAERAELLLNKGTTFTLMQNYGDASLALAEALKIYAALNFNSKVSETYNLLAKNNFLRADYGKVIDQCNESIEYAKQSNDLQNLAAAYLIMSETYAANNDFVNSQKYYKLYISTKESYEKQEEKITSGFVTKQSETKIILQKVESDIIESEMREIELLNALMTANQKEQENVFLKQQNELREKDLINKQLEKEQIQRNLLIMQSQLENEQLQLKYIEEQNEKERQIAENSENKKNLELLNTQKDAADKQNQLNTLELKATKNRQLMFMVIMGIMVLFLAFTIYFILRFRRQNRVIEKNNLIIQQTNAELVGTIEQVNIQKALIETKNEEITDSIAYAKRIQNAILPNDSLVGQCLGENFIFYRPKDIVAGDFYWLSPEEGSVLFAVADCTGHGVPGAMVSVVCHAALTRSIREFKLTQPNEILNKVRELVLETFERSGEGVNDGMDIALCNFNPKSRLLKYAGANNGIFIIRQGSLIELKADKQPIGKFINAKPFTHQEIQLEKGDQLYLFSDGFADQFGGEKGKKFKSQTFKEMLIHHRDEAMEKQRLILESAFDKWRGELEQIDDVCVMGIRI
ncbi:MAG: SpoIIE family protein phosphatase [Bacteroidetes bacterium]|nr:SpoIIE family protein phosphatase [Bacteroidota bacterium]